jgi:uncharacterized protein
MRTLIDGYNLMFAGGLLGRKFGPDGFRKVRHRFLNDLAARLDPVEAHQTTVVFDASSPPDGLPRQSRHKGLTVLFATDDENADERLEWLIARDSAPKSLTVVSSDHRVRDAARRRKARVVSADEFWTLLDARKSKARRAPPPAPSATDEDRARQAGPSPAEAAYWLAAFGDLDADPSAREALGRDFVPTDEEIARIAREVEREEP